MGIPLLHYYIIIIPICYYDDTIIPLFIPTVYGKVQVSCQWLTLERPSPRSPRSRNLEAIVWTKYPLVN